MPQPFTRKRVIVVSKDEDHGRQLQECFTSQGFPLDVYPKVYLATHSILESEGSATDPHPWLAILEMSLDDVELYQVPRVFKRACGGHSVPTIAINSEESAKEYAHRWKEVGVGHVIKPGSDYRELAAVLFKLGQKYWVTK